MVLAAKRLAALIAMIRDYDQNDVVSIIAHSQGCLISLLAQAFLMDEGQRPADTLILTHPPYSLVEETTMFFGTIETSRIFGGGQDPAMAGQPLRELGAGFYQRVFTGKQRFDPAKKTTGQVLVGLPPHDFTLRLDGEDDHAHVADANRDHRASHDEALRVPRAAVLDGGEIATGQFPATSSQAALPPKKQGAREEVDPIDAAIAVTSSAGRNSHRYPRHRQFQPARQAPWAQLDHLPTLGFIHRPTFVKMVDEHGKRLTRRDQRERALQAGWQEALRTLPETERAAAPARLIAATGGDTQQLITLHKTLMKHAQDGGAELDSGNLAQWIDTDRRLGNTGAATLFLQMAIGAMGSYRDGGVSAAVNLRNAQEASIVLVSAPSEEKRRAQKHPNGGDVFAHHGTPAIDPANYPAN